MTPENGQLVKVHLPGESPWAECIATNDDGTWLGRIENKLLSEYSEAERTKWTEENFGGGLEPIKALHRYKKNDVLRFGVDPEHNIWVPMPIKFAA